VRGYGRIDLGNETKVRRKNACKRAGEKLTQGDPKCARLKRDLPTFSLPSIMRLLVDM